GERAHERDRVGTARDGDEHRAAVLEQMPASDRLPDLREEPPCRHAPRHASRSKRRQAPSVLPLFRSFGIFRRTMPCRLLAACLLASWALVAPAVAQVKPGYDPENETHQEIMKLLR